MAILEAVVGPRPMADGNTQVARLGRQGDLITSNLHGDYTEATFRKSMFVAATQAGQTTSAGLSTTYVGLVISNPIGNTMNGIVYFVSAAFTVIAAVVNHAGLAHGYSATTNVTHTTPITPRSTLFGSNATPTLLADSSATLPAAPFYCGFLTDTPAATTNPGAAVAEVKGVFIVPPGGYFMTVTAAASSAAAFWAAIIWEEQPI